MHKSPTSQTQQSGASASQKLCNAFNKSGLDHLPVVSKTKEIIQRQNQQQKFEYIQQKKNSGTNFSSSRSPPISSKHNSLSSQKQLRNNLSGNTKLTAKVATLAKSKGWERVQETNLSHRQNSSGYGDFTIKGKNSCGGGSSDRENRKPNQLN